MSTEQDATPGDAAPDSRQALTEEIERTRTELGETVEALAAKADVKARAQDKAGEIAGRLTGTATQVKEQTSVRADQIRSDLADKTAGARRTILSAGGQVKDQVTSGTTQAAATIWKTTPEPVQRAAKRAADNASQRRVPIAVAVGAALLVGWLVARRRRR